MPEYSPFDWHSLHVERFGAQSAQCECCGQATHSIWGFISTPEECVAAYFLHFTEGRADHGADIRLAIGGWNEGAEPDERYSVFAHYRVEAQQNSFMIVDADIAPSDAHFFGKGLKRSEVIGTPLAAGIFTFLDAIYFSASGQELRSWVEKNVI